MVPGEYFFFGLQEGLDWKHTRECVRMTYTMFPEDVEAAIKVIGDEVEKAFSV